MKKTEVNENLIAIIHCLQQAQAGNDTMLVRREARTAAGRIINTLPERWWRKADAQLLQQFDSLA